MLTAGSKLGPYEIVAALGAGGMGEVYRARDLRLDREVAVKVLPAALAAQPEYTARFTREMKALAALSHPNLLAIYDTGSHDGVTYAVTELLAGETLRARLLRGCMEWREAVEIAAALADGLGAAHARGIVHRDLKPENVFLTSSGITKLLDFGLARQATDPLAATMVGDGLTPTQPGLLLGTPGYLSPEQARGEEAGAPSDLFALGCVLYEMVAGRRAFAGATLAAVLAAVMTETPAPLGGSGTAVPHELDQIVAGCLHKSATQRQQSARDLSLRCRALLQATTSVVPAAAPSKAIDSIAVLPFANPGHDPDAEYLCEGIAENILNRLAALPGLRVTPRSVALQHKESTASPLDIGRQLGVRAVLSGRLQQRAGTLVLAVELADVAAGTQLWGERYRRPLADIFDVEEELATAIAEKMRVRLGGAEGSRRTTDNPEAYRLYLLGRYHWSRRSLGDLRQSLAAFEQAIARDPAFAGAYAGLADSNCLLAVYCGEPWRESRARAKAAAVAAVAMDANSAEAHAAMGLVHFVSYEPREAEREFLRAIELEPRNLVSRYWTSYFYYYYGLFEEAEDQYREATALDPLNPLPVFSGSFGAYLSKRYEESERRLRAGLQSNPDHLLLHCILGATLAAQGRHAEALVEMELTLARTSDSAFFTGFIGSILALCGQLERARAIEAELRERAKTLPVSFYSIGLIALALGNREQALLDFEHDVKTGIGTGLFMPLDPRLDPLRSEPRFQACMRHWMGQDQPLASGSGS